MTHEELVDRAARWLSNQGYPIIATELVSGRETADVIGWKMNGWQSILIEAKISRADFRQDRKKYFRLRPEYGMGRFRYYITPPGLVKPEEILENWGLLVAGPRRITAAKEAIAFPEYNIRQEMSTLLSIVRRLGSTANEQEIGGVSLRVKAYQVQTKNTAQLILTEDNYESEFETKTPAWMPC